MNMECFYRLNLNEKAKSYTIIYVNFEEMKIQYIERYEYEGSSWKNVGKVFYMKGEGNFDPDFFIKNQGNQPADDDFEEESNDIKTMPDWKGYRDEISEIFEKYKNADEIS